LEEISLNAAKLHKELRNKGEKDAYITFTGELEPGYVVML
jgi:hypothetical protein